ncbi:hypothetical protein [Candidatus Chlorohelix sp.]|uniref:hypothetical protein n=1 Tax=Candidatus Chlorohelix sp. TaxID=3139201 RepID=UPI00303AFD9A
MNEPDELKRRIVSEQLVARNNLFELAGLSEILRPKLSPSPSFVHELIRPDDLLHLIVHGYNLKVVKNRRVSILTRINPDAKTYLVYIFPPQSIVETAFYETGSQEDLPPNIKLTRPNPEPPPENFTRPKAHIAGASRLVFQVPPQVHDITLSLESLLDWSKYELIVSTLAALPPAPSQQEIQQAPSVTQPTALETAIELPSRLFISPGNSVTWRHSKKPVTSEGRTELWHTRLGKVPLKKSESPELSPQQQVPLRAIWSPDFKPFDPPGKNDQDSDLGRSALNPNDRHQIVALTSDYHNFNKFKAPPIPPTPFYAEQLMLTALGGWLKSRGVWDYGQLQQRETIHKFVEEVTLVKAKSAFTLFDSAIFEALAQDGVFVRPVKDEFDLMEWVHKTSQGRDHYVRVVYAGHLFPFGHRASLVKVTERRFEKTNNGSVVALLRQYDYIIVREPEKVYTGQPYPHKGYEMPLKKAKITTLVTPTIKPYDTYPAKITDEAFWIIENEHGTDFQFHIVTEDISENSAEFNTPLIFIRRTGDYKPARDQYVQAHPNRTQIKLFGQKLTYAPRDQALNTDNTTLDTSALYFNVAEAASLKEEFGGFLPFLHQADVRLASYEQILGGNQSVSIKYYQNYLTSPVGLDANAGVFARLVKPFTDLEQPLEIIFGADKGGGISTPNQKLTSLTRRYGAQAGSPQKAENDDFDPADYFKDLSGSKIPKLFGALDLINILLGGKTSDKSPKVRTHQKPDGTFVVTLDWTPEIKPFEFTAVSFKPNKADGLEIHAEIEKPITGASTSLFSGKLSDFNLEIFESIELSFTEFSFENKNGQKPDVSAKLKGPPEFKGGLDFIKKLSELIPKGALGDGPSLDISATGIKLSYNIALPPVSVAVFTLKNLSFTAGLLLPFFDGKPTILFDFASREKPFLLTVSLFGGGGFVHLELDTEGMQQLEVALEFGASVGLDIGVASGSVHVMAGIYIKIQKQSDGKTSAFLEGYLRMGGELSVLGIVSVSIELYLGFRYDINTGKCLGRAILKIEVSILFFSVSVEVTVERKFGSNGGDPDFKMLVSEPAMWQDYTDAFA